jgi:hypothetical protein
MCHQPCWLLRPSGHRYIRSPIGCLSKYRAALRDMSQGCCGRDTEPDNNRAIACKIHPFGALPACLPHLLNGMDNIPRGLRAGMGP